MKLHLGCGQVYLDGYVNIDYPLTEHTVQAKSVADKFADLTKLRYLEGTIEEVRLHHVFEHFPRTSAVALLASWHSWLKKGGRVHIEVPDFDGTAELVLNLKTPEKDRKVAIRHIFGSNEAPWAVHYDGWSEERFRELFNTFGFKTEKVEKNSYLATRNIEVVAKKNKRTPSKDKIQKIAREYLRQFTVNDSEFETRLLGIWMSQFNEQLDKTFAEK
jgi:predicted SAM-dependent methyltransferase